MQTPTSPHTIGCAIATDALQWLCAIAAALPSSIVACVPDATAECDEIEGDTRNVVAFAAVFALAMSIEQAYTNAGGMYRQPAPRDEAARREHAHRIAAAIAYASANDESDAFGDGEGGAFAFVLPH